MTKKKAVTGYHARIAIMEAIAITSGTMIDLVGIALSAGKNDEEALERKIQAVMLKLQRIMALLRAALSGDYEDVRLDGEQGD